MQHLVPTVSDNPEISSGELVALLDKIGSAILVTHSQSGLFGWLVRSRSSNVMGIISYEPGFVFPRDEMPAPIPLYSAGCWNTRDACGIRQSRETSDPGGVRWMNDFAPITPHPLGLLRPRHHRPRRRAPEPSDECPPFH
jgi:hypothetical protein